MAQHALTHLLNYHFAALYVVLRPLQICFKSFDLSFLLVLERFHLVFLLDESVSIFAHIIQLCLRLAELLVTLSDRCDLFLFGLLDLGLNGLFSVASHCLEVIEFLLSRIQFLQVHLFHAGNLFLTTLDCLLKVVDGFEAALCRSLVLDKASLERIILLLRHHCRLQL